MAAAAIADDDDDDLYGTSGPVVERHTVQTQQQQQQQHVLSAADVLRHSSSSRQQLSNSLVQGLRRASSEAASASAAAAERRSSDGGSSGSALDAAGSRDSAVHWRSSGSAIKQERHSTRTRSTGDKGGGQLFASWQPGSASKHIGSSILKALQPSGKQQRSRHQRQDQAVAAAAAPLWGTVSSPIHSVVKGGRQQRRPSRALDLLLDNDSGSDA